MPEPDLEAALAHILGQIRQDSFGGRDAPVVSVSDDTGVGGDGALHGEILVHIRRRDGEQVMLDRQPLEAVRTPTTLEDTFAELLSRVLAAHHTWPR